ncbi:MAG: thiamine-monophosphate kinase [Sphingobacteriales bacterium]|jgi:thiamine-monophosphate kinase
MFENKTKTSLNNLGEFGLIEKIKESASIKLKETIKGIGDDAAVLAKNSKEYTVLTTDSLVENVHFDLSYVPLKHLGYKAVMVNLSDLAAMNAVPEQITVSIALSSKYTLEAIEEIYAGINLACSYYNVDLVGGDTTSSQFGMFINICCIGTVNKKKITYRSGAKHNDLICVSGDLGGAFLGLQVLEREKKIFLENSDIQPDLSGFDYLIERQLKPEARLDIIKALEEQEIIPTSMIDVSDGVASDIRHICTSSDVGFQLYENKLPIDQVTFDKALEMNLDPTVCALNGGEDYELLFTISQGDFEKIKKIKEVTVIGHICDTAAGYNLVTKAGTQVDLPAMGWNSFKEKN